MASREDLLRSRYSKAGQDHVFQYMESLLDSEKESLLTELEGIQVEELASLLEAARADAASSATDQVIQPFQGSVARTSDDKVVESSRAIGMEAIQKGQVAALVLAGGQGTRLGFDGPKGMYDIGLPSGRTLFALMAERIKQLSELAAADDEKAASIPFYIMTSPLNHAETSSYFETNNYFGLPADSVFLFAQGMLPCLTEEGKIIMESKSKVALAPNGNGGIYPSLQASGALEDMATRGIRYLHVFSIDNALVRPADPVFLGYCIETGADCGNKVVWKAHAHEKVGVVATKARKPCIVEYSEITKEMAEQTDVDGQLEFGAGNICNHFYTLDFIRDKILPGMGSLYHIARKKIPFYSDEKDETITPESNNGIKLETFIFDVFPMSEKMAVLSVERAEEFAPVKNAPGSPADSPDTALAMISNLSKKWIAAAGGRVAADDTVLCEVSPLLSYAGEGLEPVVKDKDFSGPDACLLEPTS